MNMTVAENVTALLSRERMSLLDAKEWAEKIERRLLVYSVDVRTKSVSDETLLQTFPSVNGISIQVFNVTAKWVETYSWDEDHLLHVSVCIANFTRLITGLRSNKDSVFKVKRDTGTSFYIKIAREA